MEIENVTLLSVWIEMKLKLNEFREKIVTPHAGVWIEMTLTARLTLLFIHHV